MRAVIALFWCSMEFIVLYCPFTKPGHRRRSNTAQRLEMMRKDKQSKGKIKNVVWKDNSLSLSGAVISLLSVEAFAKQCPAC